MHKWIAGSTCAAAVLSMAVVSAQTYPPTSDNQPTTKSRVTLTGCLMRGTDTRTESWMLSNATTAAGAPASGRISENTGSVDESRVGTSRSGSPSNEGTSAGNPNGTTRIGVSGSTSTAIGTSGTNNPTARVDTEAHGGGTLGATDQNGSTVGAGATAGVTADSADQSGQNRDTSASASGGLSYRLMGVKNPTQYANKRVEVVGTMSSTGSSGNQTLRVTSVRMLGDTCQ